MVSFASLLLFLVAVAFFTLLERKVLALIMLRRGPNKPSLIGLPTPFADAIKLLQKPFLCVTSSSLFFTRCSCLLSFIIPACLVSLVRFPSFAWDCGCTVLVILIWISLSVYALLAAGWGSNSKYSILGGTRCIAQSISYEVCLSLLLLTFCLFFSFTVLGLHVQWGLMLMAHSTSMLFLILLAETNRSPFDFAEGESELVSGYNVEYSGSGFVVLFLSEYLSIIFISLLTASLGGSGSYLSFSLLGLLLIFGFIWCRGTLPRFRYDQLISLSWKSLLPISLSSLSLFLLLYCPFFALKAHYYQVMYFIIDWLWFDLQCLHFFCFTSFQSVSFTFLLL